MDGENNGKPYFLTDDLGGKTHYFWKHPIACLNSRKLKGHVFCIAIIVASPGISDRRGSNKDLGIYWKIQKGYIEMDQTNQPGTVEAWIFQCKSNQDLKFVCLHVFRWVVSYQEPPWKGFWMGPIV